MKRKLVGLIIALSVVLTVAVCLTACNESPTVDKLIVSVNNAEYESTCDLGNFEIGTTPNLTYKVYAKYSDDSKKELTSSEYKTEYKFNGEKIDALPSTYGIGEYTIAISYEGRNITLLFNVIYASRTYQTVINKTQWAYGDEQPEIKVTPNVEPDESAYRYVEKSKVANPGNFTIDDCNNNAHTYFKESPLDPGEYYLFAIVPQTENYAETLSVLKEVKVNKANITVENADSLKATYSYNSDVSGSINSSSLQLAESPIVKSGDELYQAIEWEFEDKELSSTNNGEKIKLNFTLSEGQEKYYNAPDPIDVTMDIEKANILKPTVSDDRGELSENKIVIYVGEQGVTTWFGDWKAVNLTVTKPDGTTEKVSIDEQQNTRILLDWPTKAGTYTYKLSLTDRTNYVWSDGTTADVVKEVIIAGDDVTGKTLKFADWKTLDVNGNAVTDEENDFVGMATELRAKNLGLVDADGNPVDAESAVPSTVIAQSDGTVSGTCDFGGGTFEQLITNGEPFYYTYDARRENTVEIFAKESDVVVDESKLVGNLVGNTLTLKMRIYQTDENDQPVAEFIWVLTFTVAEATQA